MPFNLTRFTLKCLGLAIVSEDKAALFTDGRYFLQASKQLDSNWTLMKQGLPDVPSWQEYLVKVSKRCLNGIDIGYLRLVCRQRRGELCLEPRNYIIRLGKRS